MNEKKLNDFLENIQVGLVLTKIDLELQFTFNWWFKHKEKNFFKIVIHKKANTHKI